MESQVVNVVLPDGDVEVRLASLDTDAGSLVLRQVNLDDGGEVQIGGQAVVKLSSIGHVSASGKVAYLRAGGPQGPVLLELHFDSASVAKAWAQALEVAKSDDEAAPASPGANRTSPSKASSRTSPAARSSPANKIGGKTAMPASAEETNKAAAKTLRELVKQQEEQVRLLQEITSRKDAQLLKMQERLEDALGMLSVGQDAYGKQQTLLTEQQQMVDRLKAQLQASDGIIAACNANGAEAAAGLAAARAARAATAGAQTSSPVTSKVASPTASAPRQSPSSRGPQTQAPEYDDADMEESVEQTEAMLSKLRALEAEKGEMEAQLRDEQGSIFAELQELQSMMAELGLSMDDALLEAPES